MLTAFVFEADNNKVKIWYRYTRKPIDLSQVTDKLHHIQLYGVRLAMSEIRTNKSSSSNRNWLQM